jgi:hypothetical protein
MEQLRCNHNFHFHLEADRLHVMIQQVTHWKCVVSVLWLQMFLGLRLLNAGIVISDSYILHYHFGISVNGQNAVVLLVTLFCYKRCVSWMTSFTLNGITDVFCATACSALILIISVKCGHFQLLAFGFRAFSQSHQNSSGIQTTICIWLRLIL